MVSKDGAIRLFDLRPTPHGKEARLDISLFRTNE